MNKTKMLLFGALSLFAFIQMGLTDSTLTEVSFANGTPGASSTYLFDPTSSTLAGVDMAQFQPSWGPQNAFVRPNEASTFAWISNENDVFVQSVWIKFTHLIVVAKFGFRSPAFPITSWTDGPKGIEHSPTNFRFGGSNDCQTWEHLVAEYDVVWTKMDEFKSWDVPKSKQALYNCYGILIMENKIGKDGNIMAAIQGIQMWTNAEANTTSNPIYTKLPTTTYPVASEIPTAFPATTPCDSTQHPVVSMAEVEISGGSANATSSLAHLGPEKAFTRGHQWGWALAGWTFGDNPVFPAIVWYEFPVNRTFVPGRVSFRPFKNGCFKNRCFDSAPTVWQFVGSNDKECGESGDWVALCEDRSNFVDYPSEYWTKYCDVDEKIFTKFRCLGISVLNTNHRSGDAALKDVRMWRKQMVKR